MIMAAKNRNQKRPSRLDEKGQSLLEFLFMLPLMIGLIVIMVRVNTAIQVSIVNQKYSRSMAISLTQNNPYYPRKDLQGPNFIEQGFNRMVIGVADKPIQDTDNKAEATTQLVVRDQTQAGPAGASGEAQAEPIERALVRVRTTVSLCTHTMSLAPGVAANAATIGENSVFPFCRGQEGG
jgi:hypothetical protein